DVCSYDVIVSDDQNPEITCLPADTSVTMDVDECTYTNNGTGWDATAIDNCTVSSITYVLSGVTTGSGSSLDGVSFNLGTTTVTWTAVDTVGNEDVCSYDVIVSDDQNPEITCLPADTSVTMDIDECTYTNNGTGWDATAIDNCTVSSITYVLSGVTTGSGSSLDGVSFNLGTTTVTWTAVDTVGNEDVCSYNVIVSDDQNPTFIACGSGNQDVNTDADECSYTVQDNSWDATATDNCTVSTITYTLTGATTGTGTTLNGVAFNLGTTTVTWTVVDTVGNQDVCSYTVNVTDNELPAIVTCGPNGNQTVNTDPESCTYTVQNDAWDAIATDNCTVSSITYTLTGATTGTGTTLNGVTFNQDTTYVTWTVTDGSGNVDSCSFEVVVIDIEGPSIISCGGFGQQDVNTDPGVCTYTVPDNAWDASAYDNCTVSSLTYNLTGATTGTGITLNGVVFNQDTTIVTWYALDSSNNIDSCKFMVIVTDNELPVINNCVADFTVSNTQDSCGAIVNWNIPTYTDNCGATMTASHVPGDYFPIGTTTVTYTVTDNSGNVSICSFDITVNDNQKPVLVCAANIESCDSLVNFAPATATDNCGVASIVQIAGLPSGSYFPVGTTTITYEATDIHGNTNTCSFDIIIHPTPELSTQATDVTCNGIGDGSIDLTVTTGTAPYNYTWSNNAATEDVSGLQPGSYTVTVTDANGCSAQATDAIAEPESMQMQTVVQGATCEHANGSITTTVSGGVVPYQYIWSNSVTSADIIDVVSGVYTVIVTDANGCTISSTDTVSSSSNLAGYVTTEDALCYGENTGVANIVIESGNAPYVFDWSSGDTTEMVSDLYAGSYSIMVEDSFGCELELFFNVGEPEDALSVDLYSPTLNDIYNISQWGESDGSIQATAYGGTEEYYYEWSTGENTSDIYNLTADTYYITVTDANGCEVKSEIKLLQPMELEMPEGISPNGDNDNDYFVIRGIDAYPSNVITIYNRWGNVVYEQSGYNNEWEGHNNSGQELPDGTYFVIFHPTGSASEKTLTGYVDLRRGR
ncbi:gliding motility-associated C-terminal domain-containing protein, partial [Lishizhenia tianjinensis]